MSTHRRVCALAWTVLASVSISPSYGDKMGAPKNAGGGAPSGQIGKRPLPSWKKLKIPAVFLGTFQDAAGAEASYFYSETLKRVVGPLDHAVHKNADLKWVAPAPGSHKLSRPLGLGTRGNLELWALENTDSGTLPGGFLSFDPVRSPPLRKETLQEIKDPWIQGFFSKALPTSATSAQRLAHASARVLAGGKVTNILRELVPSDTSDLSLLRLSWGGWTEFWSAPPENPRSLAWAIWAPSRAWRERNVRASALEAEFQNALLGHFVPGAALWPARHLESFVQAVPGPFLHSASTWAEALTALDPELAKAAEPMLKNLFGVTQTRVLALGSDWISVDAGIGGDRAKIAPALLKSLTLKKSDQIDAVIRKLPDGSVEFVRVRKSP